jgi:[NiFe] hydrogenase diaphorase moiety large subunit
VGSRLLRNLVDKVCAGRAGRYDLAEMRQIGGVMRATSHCGLGHTAPNAVLDTLTKFPEIYERRLRSDDFEPAFDLEGALAEARQLRGGEQQASGDRL